VDLATLRRLFAYDAWSNGETLASLQAGGASEKAVSLFAHVISAECLWFDRIQGSPQRFPVWPEWSLSDCENQLPTIHDAWEDYFERIEPAHLLDRIAYVNTKGESYTNRVGDILMHVVLHSVYHRGQVATQVRGAGGEPAYTDYIESVRRGNLPGS
jgi:uncharacterized damage-inducible protein DinB